VSSLSELKDSYDAVIIGGGFFGCRLGIYLRQRLKDVLIIEMDDDLLQRASYANQARVHNGYHYPRSFLTALRCRANFPRFVAEYPECIVDDFEKYYAVGKIFSKVSAAQFRLFMERIGAETGPAPKHIRKLFNPLLIEEVFKVREFAFDAVILKDRIRKDLHKSGVCLQLGTQVEKIAPNPDSSIQVTCSRTRDPVRKRQLRAAKVYNCTYSHINQIISRSDLPMIPLKHEVTEMALIAMPDELRNLGITVMCGPYFSFMPFPPKGLHTLSHVRYTPHHYWLDEPGKPYLDAYKHLAAIQQRSSYLSMLKDVQRYIPAISQARYVDSIWEIKTVLPRSELDDSRPILLKKDYGIANFTCIMGGKIDNIYDAFAELEHLEAKTK